MRERHARKHRKGRPPPGRVFAYRKNARRIPPVSRGDSAAHPFSAEPIFHPELWPQLKEPGVPCLEREPGSMI